MRMNEDVFTKLYIGEANSCYEQVSNVPHTFSFNKQLDLTHATHNYNVTTTTEKNGK